MGRDARVILTAFLAHHWVRDANRTCGKQESGGTSCFDMHVNHDQESRSSHSWEKDQRCSRRCLTASGAREAKLDLLSATHILWEVFFSRHTCTSQQFLLPSYDLRMSSSGGRTCCAQCRNSLSWSWSPAGECPGNSNVHRSVSTQFGTLGKSHS